MQEDDREQEHEHRADHPILYQGQAKYARVAENVPEFLVLHLGERRVHHQDEADRDRNIGRADLKLIDEPLHGRHGIAQGDAHRHAQKDPERQIPIQKGKS